MSRRIRIFKVDAFTTERFTGNPAGVVLDADSLTDAEMLAIARELNNADTAFVLKPDKRFLVNLEFAAGVEGNRAVYLKFGHAW